MKTVLRVSFLLFFLFLIDQHLYAQGGVWTWMHGSGAGGTNGDYGIKGVASPTNEPPERYQTAYWTDKQGNFWIFGGVADFFDEYNDLWKYDVATNMWTWVSGEQYNNNPLGVYGTQGVPSVNNFPHGRGWGANCWTDNAGDLWLYGGNGFGSFNDLWKYNIATNEWTWVHGSNTSGSPAVYGTMGVPSPLNTPGGISECKSSWVDAQDKFWIFGGFDDIGTVNSLWKFDKVTNEWTFMKGDVISNSLGSYGVKGVEAATNLPPARYSYTKWKGADGCFYIFAGCNTASANFSDVWKFNPSTNNWTWVSGNNISNSPGNYNAQCHPDENEFPAARFENQTVSTLGCSEVFWSFGGANESSTLVNDLWLYNISNNKWTWVSGSNATASVPGSFGTIGVPSASNMIPSKAGVGIWTDTKNNLWVFGGYAFGMVKTNDLWRFTPDTTCFGAKLQSGIGLASPSDTNLCPGETAIMSNIPDGLALTYSPPAGVTPNSDTTSLTFFPASTTTYTITAMAMGGPCPGSDTLIFTLHVDPLPKAQFVINQPMLTLNTPTFSFTNQSTNAARYEWYHQGSVFSTQKEPSFTAPDTGTYCFTLIAYNNLDCADSVTHCGQIVKPGKIIIPNAFSPNGDTRNDIFKLLCEDIILKSFSVYDRWGERIFSTSDMALGWDGTYKGSLCEIGTYFYLVEYNEGGQDKILKGDVSLLR